MVYRTAPFLMTLNNP